MYEDLLNWAGYLRGTAVPGKYRDLVSILAKFADQPIHEIRRFVVAYVGEVEQIPAKLVDDSISSIAITLNLRWSIPDEVHAEYDQEVERLKGYDHQG